MTMGCEQFEILLADYLDGDLKDTTAFLAHRESCAACAALAADAESAVSFMEIAAEVEPPPILIGKILEKTNSGWELKLRAKGIRGAINRLFAPILKPRFVMGAMLTMMSVATLSRCGAGPKTTLTAADLDPVRLWSSFDDRTHRLWDRTVKSYESMRLVYEIRSQLTEWKQQQTQEEEAAADARANSRKLPVADENRATDKTNPKQEKSQ